MSYSVAGTLATVFPLLSAPVLVVALPLNAQARMWHVWIAAESSVMTGRKWKLWALRLERQPTFWSRSKSL